MGGGFGPVTADKLLANPDYEQAYTREKKTMERNLEKKEAVLKKEFGIWATRYSAAKKMRRARSGNWPSNIRYTT